MSGMIGGAGSKSGIIGETELDYETGKYTVSDLSGNVSGTATGNYTLIGDICTAQGYWQSTSTQSTNTNNPHFALPFTCSAHGLGTVMFENVELGGMYTIATVYPTHNYWRAFWVVQTNSWGLLQAGNISNNDIIVFNITYKIS